MPEWYWKIFVSKSVGQRDARICARLTNAMLSNCFRSLLNNHRVVLTKFEHVTDG